MKKRKRRKRKRKVHRPGEVCVFKLQIWDQPLLRLVEGSVCGSRLWSELRDPQDSVKHFRALIPSPLAVVILLHTCVLAVKRMFAASKLVRRRSIDGNVVTNPTLCLLPTGREVDFSDHSLRVRLVTVKPSRGISCLGFTSFQKRPPSDAKTVIT